jgi:hypothetical protein
MVDYLVSIIVVGVSNLVDHLEPMTVDHLEPMTVDHLEVMAVHLKHVRFMTTVVLC